MRFVSLIAVGVVCCSMSVSASQPEPGSWLIDVDANVTVTQNAYSDSWIGDEKGSLSWASKLDFVAERQFVSWFNHRNTLKLAFGQTKIQNDNKSWDKFLKSSDLIDFETLQKFTLDKWVDPFIAGRLISQFVDDRNPETKHYGNPMDIFESFGVARSLVTENAVKWDARFGGSIQQSVDRYFYDSLKNKRDLNVINNAGLEFVTEMKAGLRNGLLDYKGLLTVFEALISSTKEDEDFEGTPYWRYPDVNWENNLSVNLSKYVMVNLTLQLLYDREKSDKARIKEVVAVGLMYKFNNAPKNAK
jgi:hypothetical protein